MKTTLHMLTGRARELDFPVPSGPSVPPMLKYEIRLVDENAPAAPPAPAASVISDEEDDEEDGRPTVAQALEMVARIDWAHGELQRLQKVDSERRLLIERHESAVAELQRQLQQTTARMQEWEAQAQELSTRLAAHLEVCPEVAAADPPSPGEAVSPPAGAAEQAADEPPHAEPAAAARVVPPHVAAKRGKAQGHG